MKVTTDRKEMRILAVKLATSKPLAACSNDPTLKKPE